MNGIAINPPAEIADSLLYRDGAQINYLETDTYWWPWNKAQPLPPSPRSRHYNLSLSLLTARGAEMVTPLLEANPQLFSQVRTHVMKPETVALVLQQFDPSWLAPFNDILQLDDAQIAALGDLDLTNLEGDPAFLFSYESLRVLSTLYSGNEGVTHGLIAKLDAAEAAEISGNLKAKRGQLKLFENQVRSQSGNALSADQVRTMLAILKTL